MTTNDKDRPAASFRRRIIYLLFSIAVTVGIMGYLFTHVTLTEVIDLIVNMDRRGLAAFFAMSVFMSVMRTWRYALVLNLSGFRPGKVALFLVVIVRNFFSDLLPARIGTLIYIYLVNSRLGVPFGAAASSFAMAFLFDIIALAPMILVAALLVGSTGAMSAMTLVIASAALLGVFVLVLVVLPSLTGHFARLVERLSLLPARYREQWASALADVERELNRARGGSVYTKLLLISLLVRVGKYGSLYFLLYALLAPLGYTLAELDVPRVFIGLIGPELAASLPISGIGGFGAYEGTWAFIFELLGFPGQIAKLTAVSHHLFTQVYGYLLGALALLVLLIPFSGWRRSRERPGDAR